MLVRMTLQLNPNDLNGVMLERVASRLGGLCDRSAFVGGAISQDRLPG